MTAGARLAGMAAVLAVAILATPGTSHAAPGDGGPGLAIKEAKATYAVGEPIHLVFGVTNTAAAACGLSTVAEGTLQVVSVRRDGAEVASALGRSFYLDGITQAIAAGTTSVEPGARIDVALTGVRVDATTVVFRSVSALGSGGLDAHWPVGVPGRYEVTVAYAMPTVEMEVAPCSGASATTTVTFRVGDAPAAIPWLWLIVGAVVLLAVAVLLIVLLLRRRHRAGVAAVLLLLGLVVVVTGPGRPAWADYEIDPAAGVPVKGVDFEGLVNGCLAGFALPGGDPAGILNRLKDKNTPKVRIIPTTGGSGAFETPLSANGKGSSTVTWNPTSTDPYDDGVARDPCSALYHELSHSDDISRDSVPQGECGSTGIKTAEVKATLTENRYRAGKGLPPRTQYDGKPLPKNMDECKKPKPKSPPKKGPVKLCEGAGANQCGSTNGDPHLVTFDRAFYDFQAVGEFVAVRSTGGDPLEVQVRQAALGTSRTVSVNSAVAFRLGDRKVMFSLVEGVTRVWVDGAETTPARGEQSLPGGGALTRRESDIGASDGYDVRWPDGSEAAVDQIGVYGYRLLIKLASARAGSVQGLLGDFDGDSSNDIAPPSGAPLTQPVEFAKLYPAYADAWRVTADTSLFTYEGGQGTQTFTDRAFPEKPMTLADLDPNRRQQAEAICGWASIVDPWAFAECVFDVAVSGRSEFAVSIATSETVAPPVAAPITAVPIASGTLTAGSNDRITFTRKAGDAVYVDIVAPTIHDECSPYQLLAPSGQSIGSGCNINGVGYIDRTELTADGEYAVVINAREGTTGRATVRVYGSKDIKGPVEANGPAVSATFEQPGSVARYEFAGKAGQRVFVEVPESSLPDQCSPLALRDASGFTLSSGCVINGSGDIDGTLLEADGTYTVVVDPTVRSIGTISLRVYAAPDQRATIAVDGPPVTASVSSPGLVLRFEFSGTAGATLTLAATEATLPDECSPLVLLDPDGDVFRSDCIINGVGGFQDVALPATGTYTLVVDPRGASTGKVTLALRD